MKRKYPFEEKNPYERVQNMKRYKSSISRKNKIEYIFKNRDLIIINKPHDLHLQRSSLVKNKVNKEHLDNNVEDLINQQYPEMMNPKEEEKTKRQKAKRGIRFVHQLDYSTSGVLCLAYSRKECRKISDCFQNRTTKKQYLAVVFGHVKKDVQIVETMIAIDSEDPTSFRMKVNPLNEEKKKDYEMVLKDSSKQKRISKKLEGKGKSKFSKEGRYAKTEIEVLKRGYYNGFPVSKVLFSPHTGRRHQLRVHSFHIGHPILGDCCYSKDGITPRMCLHAYRLFIPLHFDSNGNIRKFKKDEENEKKEKGKWFVASDPFNDYCKEKNCEDSNENK